VSQAFADLPASFSKDEINPIHHQKVHAAFAVYLADENEANSISVCLETFEFAGLGTGV